MSRRKTIQLLLCFLMTISVAALDGCAKAKSEQAILQASIQPEKVPSLPSPTSSPPKPEEAPPLPPPQPAEVREAVTRVYQNAVTTEADRPESFIVGDFNGDGSPDLAVVVKPTDGMIPKLNSELANWILGDPQKVVRPDLKKRVHQFPPTPEPVKVQPGDVLLAMIHGYGPAGWRSPRARQTYLLKHAVGSNLRVQSVKELLSAKTSKTKLPSLNGDVVRETLEGKPGFLYWTGAKYAWFRP